MSPWAGRLTAVTPGLPARKRVFSTTVAAKATLAKSVGFVEPKERVQTAFGRRTAVTAPVSSQRMHSPILWAPGRNACAADVQALTRAIQARTANGGSALIGAKGRTSSANALRALARATRAGGNTLEFCVQWEEEGEEKKEQNEASLTSDFVLRFPLRFLLRHLHRRCSCGYRAARRSGRLALAAWLPIQLVGTSSPS